MGFVMLPNGCSWYETHRLGGCQRRPQPRPECVQRTDQHPGSSSSEHRLALLVPYRSADGHVNVMHLAELCRRLHRHLTSSRVAFEVFVINQVDSRLFNRGALVNAAAATLFGRDAASRKPHSFDYVAVHDIDRFPVSHNASGCSGAISTYYTFPSPSPRVLHPMSFAGGVLLLPLGLFRAVNGFANAYWGWGEEDNDLFLRLRWCGLPPVHPARIDWCMEHRDCAACKRQKKNLDTSVLRAHERRVHKRMPHLRRHMLHDGLSTLNFTQRGESRRMRCGPLHITAIDIDLSGHLAEVER